jgi:hypothetical protein
MLRPLRRRSGFLARPAVSASFTASPRYRLSELRPVSSRGGEWLCWSVCRSAPWMPGLIWIRDLRHWFMPSLGREAGRYGRRAGVTSAQGCAFVSFCVSGRLESATRTLARPPEAGDCYEPLRDAPSCSANAKNLGVELLSYTARGCVPDALPFMVQGEGALAGMAGVDPPDLNRRGPFLALMGATACSGPSATVGSQSTSQWGQFSPSFLGGSPNGTAVEACP